MKNSVFGIATVLLLLVACTTPEEALPDVPELEAEVWTQLSPGGDTLCSDGSAYSYFATPGTVNKLVVDFQGGGACWEAGTCALDIYDRTVTAADEPLPFGIYDRVNANNPVKDWYHVFLPYCTGDVHWGDNTVTYEGTAGEQVVNHKGAVNARAVLDWVFTEFEAPETIFMTGCSAGAYGSIMWLADIRDAYPDADVYQLGDCGAGIATQGFADVATGSWNLTAALPEQVPGLDPDAPEFTGIKPDLLTDIYSAVANHYPNTTLSQYNTVADGVQIAFYGLMKGEAFPTDTTVAEWTTRMPISLAAIDAATNNFVSYTSTFDDNDSEADGTGHCIIGRREFYTVEDNGRKLVDWLAAMLNGEMVMNVAPAVN